MMEIRSPNTQKEWDAYYDLRFRILRKPWNQPQGSERNEGDLTALHFAVWMGSTVVAVARVDETGEDDVVQVRFVAVDSDQQGRGVGKMIMQEVETVVKSRYKKQIILHARENAVQFYKRLGYTIVEKSYLLFDEIQHYLMEKKI